MKTEKQEEKKPNNLFFYTKKTSIHKNIYHKRRVTFAGVIHNDKILVGVAECSEREQFVKAKGRLIASNRANKTPCHIVEINPSINTNKQFIEACKRIVNHI